MIAVLDQQALRDHKVCHQQRPISNLLKPGSVTSIQYFVVNMYGLLVLAILVASATSWANLLRRSKENEPLIPPRFRSLSATVPPFAVAVVVAYLSLNLVLVFSAAPAREFDAEVTLQQVRGSIAEGLIAVFLVGGILVSLCPRRTDLIRLGFRLDHIKEQLTYGVRGFVVAILPVFALLMLTLPLRSNETLHPFLRLLDERGFGPEFLVVTFAAVVIAPIKEELIFRVCLQSSLTERFGAQAGIAATALIFAMVHGLPDALALLPLAIILGIVYHYRRSYVAVVITHALFNALNLSAVWIQKYAENLLGIVY
ncbi:CAAX amino terminal protease self- immunity [Thalassoglobus neptunius]|uniref:CAAX amino terminal protease self-immunity n=1 Tax=Thalassoglobus neptunius TaxID=1938619 RepID=A0A5C5X7C6_9PLAN|nr:CPBP family intramembrane glutamic endopeptidase [Thalassoglobus neptunius]TWT58804.1 CAAX amino terminal protease self- immunity [Thalassoglobus neptunius]